MYRRPTYAPAQADEHDNHHHPQHPLANPDRPLSRPDSTCDNSSRQYYHHDHEMYGFPGPSGAMGGVDPGRSVSAANFEQLRHSIAASHEQVSHDYSGLGRQVVMSGAGQLGGGEENDYNDTASPRSHYQASYHQQAPNSFTQTGVQPQHLHPLQQQPAPTYIYGQLLHRPDYTPQDGFHQAGPEAGWGEGYQSPDDTQSVWRHPLNQGEQIPAHLLPPLPPVPQSHAPASATVPRPAPYAHVYTAYSISPSAGRSGQVGGRDGWGPSEPESPYTTFGSHYPDEPAYHHPAPGVINPAYVNPNAYTTRHSAYPIAQRYTNSPLKEEEDGLPARTSSKKAAKPRSTGGPAKPRQKSVIFHPTPQAMLAPEIRLAVAASALVPRGARENTPHIGTNAPPLPSEETFKTMMTKRSRGRRPPGQADLITEVDGEDPNLNPSEAQIAYCGVTKTGKPKKIFLCKVPECGKCFKRSEHLKRHVRSIHTNEKRKHSDCVALVHVLDLADQTGLVLYSVLLPVAELREVLLQARQPESARERFRLPATPDPS